MMTVIVLGGSGMLGSMIVDFLARDALLNLISTVRNKYLAEKISGKLENVEWRILDAEKPDNKSVFAVIKDAKWIINAIGLTKPYIHDDNPSEIERAIRVNALFPYELANSALETGSKIIQIATDCVYDGEKGQYVETDLHNAGDVYGKTKSLGEAAFSNMYCLRSSIIGPEPKSNVFLLEWLRRQPHKAKVNGYMNHLWNGVTTLHFAKICHGIIRNNELLPQLHHLIPFGNVTKAKLLEIFAQKYNRNDITVQPINAKTIIDRTLSTLNPSLNQQLWKSAGYTEPPTIPAMISELAEYNCRITGI